MSSETKIKSIKDRIPVKFTFHPFVRYMMLSVSFLTAIYTLWFMVTRINGQTPFIFKIISLVILFIASNTLYSHLTQLNQVIFLQEGLVLGFIAKRRVFISWNNLKRMEIYKVVTHHIKIQYYNDSNKLETLRTNLAFPRIMEILLGIYEMCPSVETDDMLRQIIQIKKEQLRNESQEKD